jgi:hypothetical protein
MFFLQFKSSAGNISYDIPIYKSPNPLSVRVDNISPSSIIPGTKFSPEEMGEPIGNAEISMLLPDNRPVKFIKNVHTEPHQTIISYDCPDANSYNIELWQNRRLLYASELPVRQGSVVIPLPKGILADMPQRVKIWVQNSEEVKSDDYVTTIPIWNSPKNSFKKILKDLYNGFDIKFIDSLFSDHSPIILFKSTDQKVPSQKLISTINSPSLDLFPSKQIQNKSTSFRNHTVKEIGKRYFLINDQVNLSIFGFEKGRIFLSHNSFWKALINELKISNYNISALLTEIKARISGHKHFSTSIQKDNLLQLESLMIPFYFYLKTSSYQQSTKIPCPHLCPDK